MERVAVRLLKPYMQMNTGEVCTIPAKAAERLVKLNAAVRVEQPQAKPKGEEETAAPRVNKMEHGEQARPVRRASKAAANGN